MRPVLHAHKFHRMIRRRTLNGEQHDVGNAGALCRRDQVVIPFVVDRLRVVTARTGESVQC